MSRRFEELDDQSQQRAWGEILRAVQASTPHVTLNIGVGEAVSLIGALQLALRHPAFTGPTAKCAGGPATC